MATKLWNSNRKVHITKDIQRILYQIYVVLHDKLHLWETPIAHVIKREEFMILTQDASHMAIGVAILKPKMWLLIPYSKKTWHRVKLSQKNKRNIHINSLEAIAITFAFLMFLADYDKQRSIYPPQPVMLAKGDSMSANSWMRKLTTKSLMGQNAL